MAKKQAFSSVWHDRKRTLFGLPWSFTTYFLTENKFITRKGLFNLEEDELDLYKVTDKKLLLPFWQRIFGCGTIVVYVRGDTDTPMKEIHSVKKPREVLALLDKQIEALRDRYNTRGRDLISARGPHLPHDSFDDLHDSFHDTEDSEDDHEFRRE